MNGRVSGSQPQQGSNASIPPVKVSPPPPPPKPVTVAATQQVSGGKVRPAAKPSVPTAITLATKAGE